MQENSPEDSKVRLVDRELRTRNRSLPPIELLALMHAECPDLYARTARVGSWVWISFPDKQPPAVTACLSQLGFHWNAKRQLWQHPCGSFARPAAAQPAAQPSPVTA